MFQQIPLHVYFFLALLLGLSLSFLIFFCIPAYWTGRHLSALRHRLAEGLAHDIRDLDVLTQMFRDRGVLSGLWGEYVATLHPQFVVDQQTGQEVLSGFRATVPSAAVFRQDSVIDHPLLTEFFKHLPGIFTGVGIIGTFYGLMSGLQGFQVSSDIAQAHISLNQMIHGVRYAFLISFSAILLAMCVTFVEKMFLSRLLGGLERFQQNIDALFEKGAGEEYLARLVRVSEFSAHQVERVKQGVQGLVSHLGHGDQGTSHASQEELLQRLSAQLEKFLEQQSQAQQDTLQVLERLVVRLEQSQQRPSLDQHVRYERHLL